MKKLLLAYDGSPGAEAAINGLKFAGLPEQLEVRVLAVADVWVPPDALKNTVSFPEAVPEARVKARQHAMKELQHAKEMAKGCAVHLKARFPGWHIEPIARADSPAWAIIAEARKFQADLVVMGAHSKGFLQTLFLGSTSQKVASEAACSVRIVRPGEGNAIVIGVDGSPDSVVAVAEASRRRWEKGAHFHLVTVMDPRLESASAWPTFFSEAFPEEDETARAVGRMLKTNAGELKNAGLTATTEVVLGDPKVRLLERAEELNANSILIGARGLQHGNRVYLGTMAAAICARAHCTVEIVRGPELAKATEQLRATEIKIETPPAQQSA